MGTPHRRRVLNAVLIIVCVGALVALVVWMARSGELQRTVPSEEQGSAEVLGTSVDFGRFDVDTDLLDTEWAREREGLGTEPIGPAEQALIDELHRINARSLEPGVTESQVAALSERFVIQVGDYIHAHGPRAYKRLGWQLVDEFRATLDEVLAAAREMGQPATALVAGDDPRAPAWRERLGNFFTVAAATGLVDDQNRLTVAPEVATVLFRYRWFGFAQDYPSTALMLPVERVVLYRWRIEAARGLPLAQRLAMVGEVAAAYTEAGLDPEAVRGVLYYQAGQPEEAERRFRRARRAHPGDPRYAEWERAAAAAQQE